MTASKNKWLLPDGVEELLPDQAQHVEMFRRRVLDTFKLNGYLLVQPPLLEYLDSLLTGAGHDLDLLTFKVTDQHTGRMMGIRADMTPQLSRIDAHVLNQSGPTRLCYAGPVLQTAHRSGFHSREPMQIGAELFGCGKLEADVEIIRLCAEVLQCLEVNPLKFDLGHVGIFNALVSQAGLSQPQADQLLTICQQKSWPDMSTFIEKNTIRPQLADLFMDLLDLEGPPDEVFRRAKKLFKDTHEDVQDQLDQFEALISLIREYQPELDLSVDFLELRGINYHTGAVFSVYCDAFTNAIAKGGRYDDVGRAFGRARQATGFSADLRQLMNFSDFTSDFSRDPVYAPFDSDPSLRQFINELKNQGEIVIIGFGDEQYSDKARHLVKHQGQWMVEKRGRDYGE